MAQRQFEIGQRVRVKIDYPFDEEGSWHEHYANPAGLEGVVVDYNDNYRYPVQVAIEPEPDGATDAVHYFYDELYLEEELEAVE